MLPTFISLLCFSIEIKKTNAMKKTLLLFGLFVLSYAAESHDDGYSDNGKPYKKPKTDIRCKNKQDVVSLYRKGNKQKAQPAFRWANATCGYCTCACQ